MSAGSVQEIDTRRPPRCDDQYAVGTSTWSVRWSQTTFAVSATLGGQTGPGVVRR